MNYYNEIDKFAVEWLRNLIHAGLIPMGEVDTRSIADVQGRDLRGFTQCHFFCGIAGWPYALQLAGWPESRPIWSGSCPCQPFSAAGKGGGTDDPRHLWPEFYRLIRECRPVQVIGEQVASKAGLGWFDGVSADLEDAGYAVGAVDLCAAGINAPHIRQRLWWVADAERQRAGARDQGEQGQTGFGRNRHAINGEVGGLGNTLQSGLSPIGQEQAGGCTSSTWSAGRTIACGDGKTRRVGPGVTPLAHGLPRKLVPELAGLGRVGLRTAKSNRVGRLRGYGNAVVPQVAAEFISACMECAL